MIRTRKRGDSFYIDCTVGETRLRGALGTRDKKVASRLRSRIEMAMAEGSRSSNWLELRHSLPASTYQRFASATGLKVDQLPTWGSLVSIFWTDCRNRMKLGKMSANTYDRYDYAVDAFTRYLVSKFGAVDGVSLEALSADLIEAYKVKRFGEILAKPNAKDGNGLAVEVSVLHSLFQMAVDRGMLTRNPVEKGHTKTEVDVNPFTGEELRLLRDACQTDDERLIYLVLRYTGMRISDVADLKWSHVQNMEIVKKTIKRGTTVYIPIHGDLWRELAGRESAGADQPVICFKNKPATTAQIRQITHLISRRAGVEGSHPHRYRHSVALDLLMKGASTFEVAKVLGDSVATVEKHYLKLIAPMRQKLKGLMDDNTRGLEAV